MSTAFFPGKFQPVHLGHVISIMNIYEKYDKIIIGITEDSPEVLSQNERKEVFETVFRHLKKVEVVLVKEVISESNDLSHLPSFDICLTGNTKVIETMRKNGMKVEFLERSIGIGYSGTEIRSLVFK